MKEFAFIVILALAAAAGYFVASKLYKSLTGINRKWLRLALSGATFIASAFGVFFVLVLIALFTIPGMGFSR